MSTLNPGIPEPRTVCGYCWSADVDAEGDRIHRPGCESPNA